MSRRKPSSRCSRSRSDSPADIAVYLHIPFCLRKCGYCDFASVPVDEAGGPAAARRYLDAAAIEMDLRAASAEFHGAPVATLYIGGGTPTILPPEWLVAMIARLKDRFALDTGAEITVEANPGTVDERKVTALLAGGVNRLSLGLQSFSDRALQTLGRLHSADEAQHAVAAARAAGCSNLSLDLIYGIPGQSLDDWRASLDRCLGMQPEHIAAYALSVEPGTPLAHQVECGALEPPDEDLTADMYLLAAEMLTAAGYRHYEISSFATPGRESRHNRRYWANAEYLGLGASAHSYRGGIRWNNLRDPEVYIGWLDRGQLPVAEAEALSARRRVGEMLMLGLRRAEGVRETEVAARCGLGPRDVLDEEIRRMCDQGLLVSDQGVLRIPYDRWLLSNEVLSQFVV